MNRDASVHEKTVQKAARGDLAKPARRASGGRRLRATTYKEIRVDDRVMKVVRQLNPGNQRVILIRSSTEVVVTNRMRKFSA